MHRCLPIYRLVAEDVLLAYLLIGGSDQEHNVPFSEIASRKLYGLLRISDAVTQRFPRSKRIGPARCRGPPKGYYRANVGIISHIL